MPPIRGLPCGQFSNMMKFSGNIWCFGLNGSPEGSQLALGQVLWTLERQVSEMSVQSQEEVCHSVWFWRVPGLGCFDEEAIGKAHVLGVSLF